MCSNIIKYKRFFVLIIFLNSINYISNENNFQILPQYSDKQLFVWHHKKLELSNPANWPGENGEGVKVPEDKETYDKFFKINEFNVLASDRIALNRTIKDSRTDSCKDKVYRDRLPNTSVIIVFHNEAFSTLLRTIHSVIKTSSELLLEIILVDDSSNRVYLRRQLEDYVKQLSVPIKIIRISKRSGLIRARLMGSAHARGQVLTFLDSHCECNEGWLEPLLDRIAEDRTRVVTPLIDVIDENDFRYLTTTNDIYGGFNWKIGFRWYLTPERERKRRKNDPSVPIRSPTLSGGLYAIDRDFFEYIGKYDHGMIIWGAENLEISFRIWMCGGSVEIVTCSRVGHIFRSKTPYTLPGGADHVVWHNTARTVDVWMDEWKDFYYAINPSARYLEHGDIQYRVDLRKQRQCRSFRWYLDNIYPESQLPKDYHYLGDIRNIKANDLCIESVFDGKAILSKCSLEIVGHIDYRQLFMFSKQNQIISDENCLDVNSVNETVVLKRCRQNNIERQKWKYNENTLTLTHWPTNGCLDITGNTHESHLILLECDDKLVTQKWLLRDNFEWHSPTHVIKE